MLLLCDRLYCFISVASFIDIMRINGHGSWLLRKVLKLNLSCLLSFAVWLCRFRFACERSYNVVAVKTTLFCRRPYVNSGHIGTGRACAAYTGLSVLVCLSVCLSLCPRSFSPSPPAVVFDGVACFACWCCCQQPVLSVTVTLRRRPTLHDHCLATAMCWGLASVAECDVMVLYVRLYFASQW